MTVVVVPNGNGLPEIFGVGTGLFPRQIDTIVLVSLVDIPSGVQVTVKS